MSEELRILIQEDEYVDSGLDESFVDDQQVDDEDFVIHEPVVVPEGYKRVDLKAPTELFTLVGELVEDDESDGNYEVSEDDEHDSEDDMDEEEEEL
eukprot:gene2357-2825_t